MKGTITKSKATVIKYPISFKKPNHMLHFPTCTVLVEMIQCLHCTLAGIMRFPRGRTHRARMRCVIGDACARPDETR